MTEESNKRTIVVAAGQSGERLDKLVVGAIAGLGRGGARKLFDRGKVRVNGRLAPKGAVARAGDEIVVVLPDATGPEAVPEPDAPLTVVFETDAVVVAEKPAGQPTAPLEPGERRTLANALVGRYPEMAAIGYSPREPGLVHRLDTDTSGLVLAARTELAFTTLSRALKEHRIDKAYLLVCESEGLADSGVVEIPLCPHPKDRKARVRVHAPARRRALRAPPRVDVLSRRSAARASGLWSKPWRRLRSDIRSGCTWPRSGTPSPVICSTEVPRSRAFARHSLHAALIAWAGDKRRTRFRGAFGPSRRARRAARLDALSGRELRAQR